MDCVFIPILFVRLVPLVRLPEVVTPGITILSCSNLGRVVPAYYKLTRILLQIRLSDEDK